MPHAPTTLADNRVPGWFEWRAAKRLGKRINAAVDRRDAIIARRGLDAQFCLPDANWAPDAPNDYLDIYRLIRPLKWKDVRHLRFRSLIFSGFSLLHMRTAEAGMRAQFPVPDEISLAPDPPGTTLLHRELLTKHLPSARVFRPPCALGEIGWLVDGGITSYEILVYQERVTLLHQSGVLDWLERLGRPPRILEIGAGYGAIATALTSCLPGCQYTICDLPESLLFSGLYLTLAARRRVSLLDHPTVEPTPGTIELLPNYLFDDVVASGRRYDLAINVLSMSEMSDYQIATYARGLLGLLDPDGVFFEQNFSNRHIGLTYAAEVLKQVMPFCHDIDPEGIPLTQGEPRLWALNDPLPRLARSRQRAREAAEG